MYLIIQVHSWEGGNEQNTEFCTFPHACEMNNTGEGENE